MSGAAAKATPVEAVLRRDRAVVLASLAALTAICWLWLFAMAGMDGMMAPMRWSAVDFAVLFAMWTVMMIGMMVPSAAPMVLLFASVNRRQRQRGAPYVATGVFTAGYLAVWGAFSLLATFLQWALQQAALLSPMMASTSGTLSGLLLIAAGLYQLTPLKGACLEHCRAPVAFLARTWRKGAGGAFVMGLHHGAYCLGCCWVLMALLFVAGVMNLLWVAVIAGFVLLEKLAPFGVRAGRIAAALLIGAGLAMIVRTAGWPV